MRRKVNAKQIERWILQSYNFAPVKECIFVIKLYAGRMVNITLFSIYASGFQREYLKQPDLNQVHLRHCGHKRVFN